MENPVLILAFNRAELFERLFRSVVSANPPRLYVSVDGPRNGNSQDNLAVSQIRRFLKSEPLEIPLYTRFSSTNLGCRDAVVSGISWFFSREDCGVILEDDCEPSPAFFPFCDRMLERYEDYPNILSVGGYRAKTQPDRLSSVVFSRYPQVWGWATWSRVWTSYSDDISGHEALPETNSNSWKNGMRFFARVYWQSKFTQVIRKEVDTWDFQLTHLSLRKKLLNVLPPVNLIRNRGFGEAATHTLKKNPSNVNFSVAQVCQVLEAPEPVWSESYDRWLETFAYRVELGALKDLMVTLLNWLRTKV